MYLLLFAALTLRPLAVVEKEDEEKEKTTDSR